VGPESAVCKAGFCSLHGIKVGRVERLTQFERLNINPPTDRRGKHSTRPNKIPQDIVQQIVEHIRSFPCGLLTIREI
jgi:hypothetical protein